MKLGSNLYNNTSTQSLDSLGTMTGYSMIGDTYNGLMNGLTNYFQTKSNYYLQSTEMYNQTIPLYQRIGAQVREQINQQATIYEWRSRYITRNRQLCYKSYPKTGNYEVK